MTTSLEKPYSEIQKTFADTNVFITGATGFIGHVLVEKVLRSCPVNHVYLLMRPKKGKEPYTRLNAMFDGPLFSKLRSEQPNFIKRVTLIFGDCEQPNLGLSPSDEEFVVSNMNIIIHCAATIYLNGSLKRTALINVRSTRDLLLIARRTHHLKSFVYVSTAFANTNQPVSKEIIYDCHMPGETLIDMAESLSAELIDSITKQCLKTWPNTYTFSKCIAENLVKQYGQHLPISIVRPSIVTFTKDEPITGWFTNVNSVPGLCIGIIVGAIRVLLCDKDAPCVIVPADKVANLIITAVWQGSKKSNDGSVIPVFNYVPNNLAPPLTFSQTRTAMVNVIKTHKIYIDKQVWNPSLLCIKSKFFFNIFFYLYHFIPAAMVDIVLWITGHTFRVVPLYSRVYTMMLDMSYFGTGHFKFDDRNLEALISRQSAEDKVLFDIDMTKMNWDTHMLATAYGIQQYIFNQNGNTTAAKKRHRMITTAYYTFTGTLYAFLFYIMYIILNCVFKFT
ncbi:fatty acyl-CoA reductase wat-like isoform X4 [Adelges cooleyi]|uniref:fatty acyl-CoA reductase wat-like isoform X3 n=1 Tax=Adelges cooleyi TaxID=133065 RepID=UPI0021800815|nr:fatty acyl-CoA reductase wat-like isoform X3 [Adelges cooleyi]XP_050427040.1 fatty acyl-CoA reductase wat-like isoform X4 [Adelges cooleyi]